MKAFPAIAIALLASFPADAAERRWPVGSFERVRVEGPVAVTIARGDPRAVASGDRAALARLTVAVDGGTLVVRVAGAAWRGEDVATDPIVVLSLATPRLASVMLVGGAPVTVAGMAGQRVDLTLNGGGSLSVDAIDTPALSATLVGGGTMTLAGRAATARLTANGAGTMAAEALHADMLSVQRVDSGETRATARYAATVVATQKGRVTVTGTTTCDVRATGGAVVHCGRAAPAAR